MKKDYFAALGLKPTASEKEIRSAYKRLAKRYHPDLNPGDKRAEDKFKEISEAHEVLTDPAKRRKWEAGDLDFETIFGGMGRDRARGGRRQPFRGVDFGEGSDLGGIFDLFGDLGGMGAGAARGRGSQGTRGADLQYEASISFEESVQGTTLQIPLARTAPCKSCNATGSVASRSRRSCPRCGGAGHVAMARGPLRMSAPCPDCGGTGRVVDPCPQCDGVGARRVNENIKVRIRPGVEDSDKVRARGKGEAGERGGPAGDLYVVLRVRPHRCFRKEGENIVMDLPLSLTEAALGTKLEVPTMAGRVTLTVPPGSASGQKLRIKGRGVRDSGRGTNGDQIVVIQIVTPKKMDPASRRLLEDFQSRNPYNPREGLNW